MTDMQCGTIINKLIRLVMAPVDGDNKIDLIGGANTKSKDPSGYNYWMEKLNSGSSRDEVLNGFIYSQEFINLCLVYSILAVK